MMVCHVYIAVYSSVRSVQCCKEESRSPNSMTRCSVEFARLFFFFSICSPFGLLGAARCFPRELARFVIGLTNEQRSGTEKGGPVVSWNAFAAFWRCLRCAAGPVWAPQRMRAQRLQESVRFARPRCLSGSPLVMHPKRSFCETAPKMYTKKIIFRALAGRNFSLTVCWFYMPPRTLACLLAYSYACMHACMHVWDFIKHKKKQKNCYYNLLLAIKWFLPCFHFLPGGRGFRVHVALPRVWWYAVDGLQRRIGNRVQRPLHRVTWTSHMSRRCMLVYVHTRMLVTCHLCAPDSRSHTQVNRTGIDTRIDKALPRLSLPVLSCPVLSCSVPPSPVLLAARFVCVYCTCGHVCPVYVSYICMYLCRYACMHLSLYLCMYDRMCMFCIYLYVASPRPRFVLSLHFAYYGISIIIYQLRMRLFFLVMC